MAKINEDGSVTIEDQDLENDTDEVKTEGVTDEDLKKDLQTTIAKKKAWREKATDPDSGKSYKELYEESVKKQTTDTKGEEGKEKKEDNSEGIQKDIALLKEESQKRIFQHANELSSEQVDEVFAYARGSGIEPKDALEKPFMKGILNQMATDKDNANASLSPSHRAPVQIKGKSFKDMTADERKEAFPSFSK